MTISKKFKIIIGLAVLLNILHGVEVSLTHFYITNPNFYPYTKLFTTIPEAVYYVQHGMLYLSLILFFFFILGGKWRLIPFAFFGYLLVAETHHFFRSIISLSYQSGMITSGLFIIMSYFFIKQLIHEYKNI